MPGGAHVCFQVICYQSNLTGNLINIRSIRNKSVAFADFINSNKSDVIAVNKTWLRPDDTDCFIANVTPPGYICTCVPHSEGRGGAGFFIPDDIGFKVLPQPCVNTFKSISVRLSVGNTQDIIFHTLYRPLNVSKADFIEEFSTTISYWNNQDAGTIPLSLLKIMVTPRLCGTLSRKSCTKPQLSSYPIILVLLI